MSVTFEFATHDDCLDKMVPSDLRDLVAERDELRSLLIESAVKFAAYRDEGFKGPPINLMHRIDDCLKPDSGITGGKERSE